MATEEVKEITEAVKEITIAYIGNLARLANAQAAYWLADEVVKQKTSNLRDTAFLGIALLVLEQDRMATDEIRGRIDKALNVAKFYFAGKLN